MSGCLLTTGIMYLISQLTIPPSLKTAAYFLSMAGGAVAARKGTTLGMTLGTRLYQIDSDKSLAYTPDSTFALAGILQRIEIRQAICPLQHSTTTVTPPPEAKLDESGVMRLATGR